jgi:hypothetical protein
LAALGRPAAVLAPERARLALFCALAVFRSVGRAAFRLAIAVILSCRSIRAPRAVRSGAVLVASFTLTVSDK